MYVYKNVGRSMKFEEWVDEYVESDNGARGWRVFPDVT